MIVSFSLDAWDGALARALGIASDAGEALDAMIDRTVAVSYIRGKGAALAVDPVFGCMQRHERGVWLALATVVAPAVAALAEQPSRHPAYYVVVVALAAVAIGTNLTAIRRTQFVVARLEERRRTLAA